MKYINTREAYLKSINETFSNEITWGGSLLGRLVNSIIRKAKVEINYQKVKSIAGAIKIELDSLIASGLSDEDKKLIAQVTAKALLEEIHNVVISDEDEKTKLYYLLDKNKVGLISKAIEFLEILPEGTNLGKGTKEELIEKLKKFKTLLESISENTEELTEEEKEKVAKKVDDENVDGDDTSDDTVNDTEEEKDDSVSTTEIDDEHELEETPIENEFDATYKLLESILGMSKSINEANKTKTDEPQETQAQEVQGQNIEQDEKEHEKEPSNGLVRKSPNFTVWSKYHHNTKEPISLNRGTKAIEQPKQAQIGQGNSPKQIGQGNSPKQIGTGQRENMLNFWEFFSHINELRIDGPKSTEIGEHRPNTNGAKANIDGPKWKVVDPGGKKGKTKTKVGHEIPFEDIPDNSYLPFEDIPNKKTDKNNNNSELWQKIMRVWKNSGISEHIPMISSLIEKSKDENAIERKWIIRIGKQLKVNAITHGKNMHDKLVAEASSDVISTAIPKSISLLANAFFALRNSNTKILGDFEGPLKTFNACFEVIVKPEKTLKSEKPKDNLNTEEPKKDLDNKQEAEVKQVPQRYNNEPEDLEDISKHKSKKEHPFADLHNLTNGNTTYDKEVAKWKDYSEKTINHFLDLLKEADEAPEIPDEHKKHLPDSQEHDLEETSVDDENNNSNLDVKGAWDQVFEEEEENKWKLSEQEAKQAQNKIKDAKFIINTTDEDNKDRLIKITDLFGRAYRCYVTSVIPSGRPGGKVSNLTFREYIHLGTGTPGTPDAPGAGPWANMRVFHSFVNYISSYIENEDYKQIFNDGKIKMTNGKLLRGNVLLEFIRSMIDQNALDNFDKRRTEFLNKYFGLEGYTYKDPEGKSGGNPNKSEHAEADENLQWQSINNITVNNVDNIKKGSFLAFNVAFKLDGKNEDHKVIIGQVLEIKSSKIILKWLYDNEAIPHAYAGAKLIHGYSYTAPDLKNPPRVEAGPKESLYIGLIDLDMKVKTKLNGSTSDTETQGVLPNHNFFMASKDITKIDNSTDYNYHRVHYTPFQNKLGVVNRVIKNPISILVKSDKQGNKNPVIGDLDKLASKSIIPTDKIIDLDRTVDQLTNYIDRNKSKI